MKTYDCCIFLRGRWISNRSAWQRVWIISFDVSHVRRGADNKRGEQISFPLHLTWINRSISSILAYSLNRDDIGPTCEIKLLCIDRTMSVSSLAADTPNKMLCKTIPSILTYNPATSISQMPVMTPLHNPHRTVSRWACVVFSMLSTCTKFALFGQYFPTLPVVT